MSLKHWYKLDGDATDSVGSLDGSATITSWVDGKIGQCGNFDGVNDVISFGEGSNIFSPNLSLAIWFKSYGDTPTTGTAPAIFGLTYGLRFFVTSTDCYFGWDDGATFRSISSNLNLQNDGIWHHAVATLSPSKVSFYIDGVLIGTNTTNHWLGTTRWPTNGSYLGRDNNNTNYFFKGLLDDFRIYDHELSYKEVKELSKAKVLHYKFNDFQEPTTNVITNTDLNTGWSTSYCTGILWDDISPPPGVNSPVVSFYDANTDLNAYWYCYGDYAPQNPDTTYTVSMYVKTNDSGFNIHFYTADNSEAGRYSSEYIDVPNDGEWHRIVWDSFLNIATSESDSLSFHFNFSDAQGESQRTWFCAPQMEAKDHATPFVNGSRTGTVHDCTEYKNHTDLSESYSPKWSENNKIGTGCYEFDGLGVADNSVQGNYIVVTESLTNTLDYPEGCTYSFWINVDTDSADRIGLLYGAGTIRHIELYSSGKYFRTEAATENGYSFGSGTFPDSVRGTWSHFAIVFDNLGTNRPVRWYQNGTLFYTGYMGNGVNPTTEYFSFNKIGHAAYSTSFDGKMDDFKIYAHPLSADDVLELYQTRASIDNSGNLICNEFVENTINRCPDFNEWTLTGGAYLEDDGATVVIPDGGFIESPYIYVGGMPNSWNFICWYYSLDQCQNVTYQPDAGYLQGSDHYDDALQLVDNNNGYSSNGNAARFSTDTWTRKQWTNSAGTQVKYIKIHINESNTYTAAKYKVVKPMLIDSDISYDYLNDDFIPCSTKLLPAADGTEKQNITSTGIQNATELIESTLFNKSDYLDYNDWVLGSTGSQGVFSQNGSTSENSIINHPNPWGYIVPTWYCNPDNISGPDGGWDATFNASETETLRMSVFVKKTGSTDGSTYFGCSNTTTYNLAGTANTNPYFWAGELPARDTWYLVVGIVHPSDYSGSDTAIAGVYDMYGNRVISGTEYKWEAAATAQTMRAYLYYSTDLLAKQYFVYPRVDIVDGTEPTLEDIISGKEMLLYNFDSSCSITSNGVHIKNQLLETDK